MSVFHNILYVHFWDANRDVFQRVLWHIAMVSCFLRGKKQFGNEALKMPVGLQRCWEKAIFVMHWSRPLLSVFPSCLAFKIDSAWICFSCVLFGVVNFLATATGEIWEYLVLYSACNRRNANKYRQVNFPLRFYSVPSFILGCLVMAVVILNCLSDVKFGSI